MCQRVVKNKAGWGVGRRRREHLSVWTHSSFQHPSCARGPKTADGIPLFVSSRPVRFVDDRISVGLNQPVPLLNLAWPITPAGNVAQSMLQLMILVLWIFNVCAYTVGTLAVMCSLAMCHCRRMSLWHCVVLLVYVRSLFLCATVRCCKSFMDLCAAGNAEEENPPPSVHTSVFRHGSGGNCCSLLL